MSELFLAGYICSVLADSTAKPWPTGDLNTLSVDPQTLQNQMPPC